MYRKSSAQRNISNLILTFAVSSVPIIGGAVWLSLFPGNISKGTMSFSFTVIEAM